MASSDSDEFGAMTEIIARAGSQLISFLAVAAIVLATSPRLGVVVLVAAPILVAVALPFLRPLHRRQEVERSRNSELTSMATDIVAGLRILRGIGGERTFRRNYERQSQSCPGRGRLGRHLAGGHRGAGRAVLRRLPGAAAVARGPRGGRRPPHRRRADRFLGYGLYLIGPIRTFFEFAQKVTRAHGQRPQGDRDLRAAAAVATRPRQPTQLDGGASLYDDASGFSARPGELTVVVSAVPDDSARLADRLGRYLPPDTEPVSEEDEERAKGRAARRARSERARRRAEIAARDAERTRGAWGVRLGGVDLGDASLADVRRTVLVSDTTSQLFAGTLQDAVDPHRRLTRQQAEEALLAANAEDVYDALPGGWQGEHRRARPRSVRRPAAAGRAGPRARRRGTGAGAGRADLGGRRPHRGPDRRAGRPRCAPGGRRSSCTVSPLWLHHADRVVLLDDDRVVADGRHEDLLRDDPPTGPSWPAAWTRRWRDDR